MTCCTAGGAAAAASLTGFHCGRTDALEDEIQAQSTELPDGSQRTIFVVPSLHCSACLTKIEQNLAGLPQVKSVRANLSNRRVTVIWDDREGRGTAIRRALSDLGFEHHLLGLGDANEAHLEAQGRFLLLCLAVAGFAAANIMLLSVSVWSGADHATTQLFHLISGLIAVPAVFFAGRPFFSSALAALSVKRLNMDVPISLAVLLSLAMGVFESLNGGHEAYFDACVTLLFFLLIGRTLDHHMRLKARGAVASLARLSSPGAMQVLDDGTVAYLATDEIEDGMRLRINAGDRLPVDGVVLQGRTDIDRSLVTGESEPVSIEEGAELEAGTLNLTGSFDLRARGTAETSFLSEIQRMMEAAEEGRGSYRRIADRLASIYAPVVHLLALVTFIGWMIVTGGDWKASLYTSIAVLIITCPCALGLAVPVVHVIGASRLFREGILVRDGGALERMAEIDTVLYDKTGTLTDGEPQVERTEGLRSHHMPALFALASRSSHPASRALLAHFSARLKSDGHDPQAADIKERPGLGMEGLIDGLRVRLGRPAWALEFAKGPVPTGLQSANIVFAREDGEIALFSTRDRLRADARESVTRMKNLGLNGQILSGDTRHKVWTLGAELNLSQVEGDLLPSQKLAHIERLGAQGRRALMVGDGLNDAPALTAAHVSMAPATASEVGRMAADFVFLGRSLGAVPVAFEIAKHTGRFVRQNFALALLYNAIAIPMAVAGFVTPLIAAIAMSASSIVVVGNSMRLWRVRVFEASNENSDEIAARNHSNIPAARSISGEGAVA